MALFEALNTIDTRILLGINGTHTEYLDVFFALFTSKEVWIPLYLVILAVIVIKYKRSSFWLILTLILTILISDQTSVFIKELVQRLRPSHAPALLGMMNLPVGTGGLYGFVSSHATNSFALVTLIGFLSKCSRMWISLLIWAILVGYSRIYLGVHYPFDVLGGAILGALVGWGMYHALLFFDHRILGGKIIFAGTCENHQIAPVLQALIIITVTLAIAAMVFVKYQL